MEWAEWNRRGLIPGPTEGEESFLDRVKLAERVSDGEVGLYGISPDWVEMRESDRGLMPWHGAVMTTDGSKAALQIRRRLPWGYDRDELIAHELAHAGRCAFNEPVFEEFFAYRLSRRHWRRFLGPIIGHSWEVWVLPAAMAAGAWLPLLPPAVIIFGFTRLIWRHWTLRRCIRSLYKSVGSRAWEVAYRLTDREIRAAAKGRLRSDDSLRWRMINAVYELSY